MKTERAAILLCDPLQRKLQLGSWRANFKKPVIGSAMLQLAKLAGVEMYGTCSAQGVTVVRELGGIPIDYKNADFVQEIHRLAGDGVDAVFDGIGGDNLWRSRDALREGGVVVTYGFQSKMRGGRMASSRPGRHPVP